MVLVNDPDFHRKNGLTFPWDPFQIFAWFITAFLIVSFFVINYPMLPHKKTISWSVVFSACFIISIVLFAFATFSENKLQPAYSPDHTFSCRYCGNGVPIDSKHCRMCNQCRSGFDHHCRYINNCVTESNYFVFFFGCLFLVSTSFIGIAHLIVSGIEYKNDREGVLKRMSDYYNRKTTTAVFWVLFAVSLAIDLTVLSPMLILTIHHIYFQSVNITTYDYIIRNFAKAPQKLQRFGCYSSRVNQVKAE